MSEIAKKKVADFSKKGGVKSFSSGAKSVLKDAGKVLSDNGLKIAAAGAFALVPGGQLKSAEILADVAFDVVAKQKANRANKPKVNVTEKQQAKANALVASAKKQIAVKQTANIAAKAKTVNNR